MRSIGLGVLALVLACSKGEPTPTRDRQSATPPLAPEILAPFEQRLEAALAENARRSCPRPVLRGDAAPGKADAAIRAIMEPSPALQACFDAVGETRASVEPCATLPAAVEAAAAHADACSPYLLGRNPSPPSLTPYIRTAKALVAIGDAWIDAGREREAWALWLDGIRLGQDLARGGTTWLEAMVTHAGAMILIEHAHEAVERSGLSTEDLEGIGREVAKLVASEPHPRTHMLGDRLYPLLYEVAPKLKPEGWVPPGGWPPDESHPGVAGPDEQHQLFIAWQTLERIAAKQAEACPADSDVAACLSGLDELVARMVEAGTPGMADVLGLAFDPEQASTDRIAATLEAMVAPSWSKYLKRQAVRRVALHALALHVTARAGAGCPASGSPALAVPGLGDALRVDAEGDGVVLVAPKLVTADEPLQWSVSCSG